MEEDTGETSPNPNSPESTSVIKEDASKKEASNEDKEEKSPEVVPSSSAGQPPATGNAAAPAAAAAPANESEGDESEDDESEILEESPCGRWLKRREVVSYRDVPGIDCAYLAMDTEEGVEVVWNEATFSEAKKFKAQEDKLRSVFEILTLIDHPNIVKFHKYWTDEGKADDKAKDNLKPRVVLITEYMSSGSLKQFLKKTKKNSRKIPLQSWRRWCTQILSALSYLHSFKVKVHSYIWGNLKFWTPVCQSGMFSGSYNSRQPNV